MSRLILLSLISATGIGIFFGNIGHGTAFVQYKELTLIGLAAMALLVASTIASKLMPSAKPSVPSAVIFLGGLALIQPLIANADTASYTALFFTIGTMGSLMGIVGQTYGTISLRRKSPAQVTKTDIIEEHEQRLNMQDTTMASVRADLSQVLGRIDTFHNDMATRLTRLENGKSHSASEAVPQAIQQQPPSQPAQQNGHDGQPTAKPEAKPDSDQFSRVLQEAQHPIETATPEAKPDYNRSASSGVTISDKQMKCPDCGQVNEMFSPFCNKCGKPFVDLTGGSK